jgi:dihydrofolate reductase
MRKLVAISHVTLDGVMQAPGGPDEDPTGGFEHGGWAVGYFDDALMEEMRSAMETPVDLVLGRKTYGSSRRTGPSTRGRSRTA